MNKPVLDPADIAAQIAEACDRNRDALLGVVQLLATAEASPAPVNERADKIRHTLDEIKAKDFVSPNEAALLFGCSPQHLRNLVQRAIDKKTDYPIPFRDLDGVVTFPVSELLEWSRTPKPKIKKPSRKNKTALRALAS
jgi:hypothetical protein